MAQTNAERQAAHRAKKDAALEQISQELAATVAENRELREKIESLQKQLAAQAATHARKTASLEKRLLNALERAQKTEAVK